jgi:hypothetical protein
MASTQVSASMGGSDVESDRFWVKILRKQHDFLWNCSKIEGMSDNMLYKLSERVEMYNRSERTSQEVAEAYSQSFDWVSSKATIILDFLFVSS